MQEQNVRWYSAYANPHPFSHIAFDLGLGLVCGTFWNGEFHSDIHPWLGWNRDMVKRWRYVGAWE